MNPFTLPGPQFLGFYALLLLLCAGILFLVGNLLKGNINFRGSMTDPYAIAYLRGGPEESLKIATASLAHRGWLKVSGKTIISDELKIDLTNNTLEKSILYECVQANTFNSLADSRAAKVATTLYDRNLAKDGLILNYEQRRLFLILKLSLSIFLIAIAGYKILIGIQKGKPILFLVLLAAIGIFGLLKIKFWKTPTGKTVLQDLKTLFSRLREQQERLVRPDRNRDFSFLAAVFGLEDLHHGFSFVSGLKRMQEGNRSNSSCSSSGHSCSGGSSCGGGCGGGCGGCGG